MTRTVPALAAGLLVAALVAGCSLLGGESGTSSSPPSWDPAASLTESGQLLAESAGLRSAPTYDVEAEVTPGTGRVDGTVRLDLPVGGADEVRLRYFAGTPDLEAAAEVGDVTVAGEAAEARLDSALLRVPLPDGHGDRVVLVVPFRYRLPVSEPGGGLLDALGGLGGPADVGLLARHDDSVSLGHWFPLWIPPGNSADPEPAGFGDIGNSPAALMRLSLTVPDGWQVVDGGVRTGSDSEDGRLTVTSEGYGMNDLVVSVVRGYAVRERELRGDLAGVTVRAYGPEESADELKGVLDETATSLEVLSHHLVAYPWREFDVVSAPLGSGVAGMEWPGATWIEPALFAGGIPGLGGLEDLLGGAGGPDGLEGLDGLDDLLGGAGGQLGLSLNGETARMMKTLRPWTIAHEVGHEWWHILVGNDSVLDPAVDEPLAQYSACLVLRELRGDTARTTDLCDAHIESGYEQMRQLGGEDAPADQASDDFDSSLQYAGVVYGKAAAFYRELEDRFGRARVIAALAAVTEEHAFDQLTVADLRTALAAELPAEDFEPLWRRWMTGTHGDEDLGVDAESAGGAAGGADGLGGLLEGLGDGQDLDGLLEDLLGGNSGQSPDLGDLLGPVLTPGLTPGLTPKEPNA